MTGIDLNEVVRLAAGGPSSISMAEVHRQAAALQRRRRVGRTVLGGTMVVVAAAGLFGLTVGPSERAVVSAVAADQLPVFEQPLVLGPVPDRESAELIEAVQARDRGRTEAALAAGGDLEAGTRITGLTPLMIAAYRNDTELVELLLSAGADATTENRHGQTALAMAARGGADETWALLVERFGLTDADATDSLFAALRARDEALLQAAVDRGASIEIYGPEALKVAISDLDSPVLVAALLELGADPDRSSSLGMSAREMAERRNDPEYLDLLG